jgi:nicotinate-nucleotide adenylyltransferase
MTPETDQATNQGMKPPMTEEMNEPLRIPAPDDALRPVVIFGGSFDPPHRRHVEVARGVDALLEARQLLVIPARRNPQRAGGPVMDGPHRLALCELAFGDLPGCSVLTIELDREGPSFTIDTVREVLRMQQEGGVLRGPLRLVVGSDQALNFRTWKDWEELANLATPAVVLRPPHTRADWPRTLAEHMDPAWAAKWLSWTLPIEPVECSSTEVRRRLAAGEELGDLVTPAVGASLRKFAAG